MQTSGIEKRHIHSLRRQMKICKQLLCLTEKMRSNLRKLIEQNKIDENRIDGRMRNEIENKTQRMTSGKTTIKKIIK